MKLSVIVPIYNTEQYLKECLNSLISQTIPFYEIILINDGSTDNSLNICREYSKKFENVILVNQNNQGLGAARNNGLKLATGDYVVFVDSDDLVSETMNERLTNSLTINNLDVLYYSANIKDEIGLDVGNNEYLRKKEICNQLLDGKKFLYYSFPDNYIVSACCAIYKIEFLKNYNILFPEGVYYEDNPFFIDVVLNAKKIECTQDMLYIRRYRTGSITCSNLNIKKCEDLVAVQYLIWKSIKRNSIVDECKEFICKYVINTSRSVMNKISPFKELLYKKNIYFIDILIENWFEFFLNNNLDWNDLNILLIDFMKAWIDSGKINEKCRYYFDNIKKKYQEKLVGKLRGLPFSKNTKVGIYGIGNHTKALFELYNKLIGEIICDYYFIVSDKLANSFMGKKVVDCDEIKNDTDFIVVSSMIYQEEIVDRLKGKNIEQSKIVTLYEQNEKYDIALALNIVTCQKA